MRFAILFCACLIFVRFVVLVFVLVRVIFFSFWVWLSEVIFTGVVSCLCVSPLILGSSFAFDSIFLISGFIASSTLWHSVTTSLRSHFRHPTLHSQVFWFLLWFSALRSGEAYIWDTALWCATLSTYNNLVYTPLLLLSVCSPPKYQSLTLYSEHRWVAWNIISRSYPHQFYFIVLLTKIISASSSVAATNIWLLFWREPLRCALVRYVFLCNLAAKPFSLFSMWCWSAR